MNPHSPQASLQPGGWSEMSFPAAESGMRHPQVAPTRRPPTYDLWMIGFMYVPPTYSRKPVVGPLSRPPTVALHEKPMTLTCAGTRITTPTKIRPA